MHTDTDNPLTDTHRAELEEALRRLTKLKGFLLRCDRAKVPIDGPTKDCEFLLHQISAIYDEFFGLGKQQ